MAIPAHSRWVFLDDQWVPAKHACLSVFDHGFLYGDGVFETLRAYQGQVPWLDRHLARLFRSCERLRLSPPISLERWPSVLAELLARNHLADAMIRITISRGAGDLGLDPALCPRPTVVAIAKPLAPCPMTVKNQGVRLAVATVRRNAPSAQPPEIKSISFLNNILAKHESLDAEAFDAVMLNAAGDVAECTTSNIFFVDEEGLCTPAHACGILGGITRDVVIDLARGDGCPVREGHYPLDRLLAAQECFLTNTGMEIMPVRQIGPRPIGSTCPGPVTRRLQALFAKEVHRCLARSSEMPADRDGGPYPT